MKLSIIVAMASNRVIGKDNGLPWHLPEDLKHFKRVTMSCPIIMGRKTFESIGRPLPGRKNIVVTRDKRWKHEGLDVAHSLDQAISIAELSLAELSKHSVEKNKDEIFIIGGAEIYANALSRCNRIYMTEVHVAVDGDAVFPSLDENSWREVERIDCEGGEADGQRRPAYSFTVLQRESGLA